MSIHAHEVIYKRAESLKHFRVKVINERKNLIFPAGGKQLYIFVMDS